MNKRRLLRGLLRLPENWIVGFLVCGVLLAVGVAVGSFESLTFCEDGAAGAFLGEYLDGIGEGVVEGPLRFFLSVSADSIAAFLMGFSLLGVAGIPILSLVRGFSAGFALSVFVRLYSGDGVAAGLLLVGIRTAVSVPIFLAVASQSLRASVELARLGLFSTASGAGIYTKSYFFRFFTAMICLLLLSAGGRALLNWGIARLPILA